MPRLNESQWAQVEAEWIANQLTVRQIGKLYGVAHQAISARAREKGWPDREKVRKIPVRKPEKKVAKAEKVATPVTEVEVGNFERQVALLSFQRVIELLRNHRRELGGLHLRMQSCLDRVDGLVERRKQDGRPLSLREEAVLMGIVSDASQILSRLIPMERKAFGLTDQDGPSEIDGFTEEELSEIEGLVRVALARVRKEA